MDFPPITPLLPLGISFFVFEFIHYQVDINRGSVPVKNWLEFSIFGAFFPTQIAGPIKRYEDFVPQLNRQPSFSLPRIGEGLKYILWGLFKKVVLADNLAPLVAIGFGQAVGGAGGNASLSSGDAWLTVLAFTLQIYFDFSGYTDMGRGSAMLLGFNLPENFKFPYLAANISDFWRRWHITLSGWLRDYIYIPLGGNRKGRYRNLLITTVLGGLWHGANWTFIIWGLYHGIGLTVFWLWRSLGLNFDRFRVWKLLNWGATFLFVFFGWIFFRSENLDQAGSMFKAVLAMNNGPANVFLDYERIFILTVLISWGIVEITLMNKTWLKDHLPQGSTALIQFLRPTIYSLILVLILLLNPANSGPQFIYFQF